MITELVYSRPKGICRRLVIVAEKEQKEFSSEVGDNK